VSASPHSRHRCAVSSLMRSSEEACQEECCQHRPLHNKEKAHGQITDRGAHHGQCVLGTAWRNCRGLSSAPRSSASLIGRGTRGRCFPLTKQDSRSSRCAMSLIRLGCGLGYPERPDWTCVMWMAKHGWSSPWTKRGFPRSSSAIESIRRSRSTPRKPSGRTAGPRTVFFLVF
jgi:hypothetical protein